jgi:hypothetical protein
VLWSILSQTALVTLLRIKTVDNKSFDILRWQLAQYYYVFVKFVEILKRRKVERHVVEIEKKT